MIRILLAVVLGCVLVSTVRGQPSAPAAPRPSVRLAVLLMFDQLRGDYLERWDKLFGKEGFHRLTQEGLWFQNCHYPYAGTFTGPGHASVLTGCFPFRHGIVANEWYDPVSKEFIYCAGSDRYQRVPPLQNPPKTTKKGNGQGNPDRLLVPTLGDALKDATAGKGRVFAFSFKDRSAVLPAGHRPDGCYWFDTTTGEVITSTYYRDSVHPWVRDFQKTRPLDRWFGKEWTRLRSDLDYAQFSGPDEVAGEGKGSAQGRTFPHPFGKKAEKPEKEYYTAVYNSPFGNEVLLQLVKKGIEAEKLGTRDIPDLLTISFSSNDPVGHCWGPDSQEVLDTTLRADLIVRDLLAYLDKQVGKEHYVLVLTADHGVCPLPEVSAKRGKQAKRIPIAPLLKAAEKHLEEKFGAEQDESITYIEQVENNWIWLNRSLLKARKLELAVVEAELARWLQKQPGIARTYTATQLRKGRPTNDRLAEMEWLSFQSTRCGEVLVRLEPFYLFSTSSITTGTTHGTPYEYDTHVPLIVYGAGVRTAVRKDRVTPQAAAPILAHALGIRPPRTCETPLPAEVFTGQR